MRFMITRKAFVVPSPTAGHIPASQTIGSLRIYQRQGTHALGHRGEILCRICANYEALGWRRILFGDDPSKVLLPVEKDYDDLCFWNVAGDLRVDIHTWVAMIGLEMSERNVNEVAAVTVGKPSKMRVSCESYLPRLMTSTHDFSARLTTPPMCALKVRDCPRTRHFMP